MKIIGWTSDDDERFENIERNTEEFSLAWGTTVEYMKKHGLRFGGNVHSTHVYGVPYFDNGKKLVMGLRPWGHLMVAVADLAPDIGEDGSDYAYCQWGFSNSKDPVYPTHHLAATREIKIDMLTRNKKAIEDCINYHEERVKELGAKPSAQEYKNNLVELTKELDEVKAALADEGI